MNTPIDLARTIEMPMDVNPVSYPAKSREPRVYYPSFTISGEEQLDLPEEGVMTIRYCLTREAKNLREGDESSYSCDIDVKQILKVEGEKDDSPTRKYSEAEDALDKLAEAHSKKKGY